MMDKALSQKYDMLRSYIQDRGKGGVVVAFSGGVDSSTLAAICHEVLGNKAVAATARSPIHPAEEMIDAERVAKEIGIGQYVIETDELSQSDFVRNPENRCYYCKRGLLARFQDLADRLGFKAIFEGTNFSDLSGHRPGFKAVKEAENVFSPWAQNGFTKEEIRALARELGLSLHGKPAMACLASRIPYGENITEERLDRIARAEQLIRKTAGVRQIRVRDHNGLARIEVEPDERRRFFSSEIMNKVGEELKQLGFKFVALDLEGYRTGSMLLDLAKASSDTNPM